MIEIRFEKDKNRAAAYYMDKEIGQATFSISENVWNLDHTFVDKEYNGQGIASNLVKTVVEGARKEGFKINPVCPYALKEFDKRDEYKDVWANQ